MENKTIKINMEVTANVNKVDKTPQKKSRQKYSFNNTINGNQARSALKISPQGHP
jgi:hypothetical protein